ncbi:MAG: hypothetical protein U1B78_01265, partial [Dehalococcoidia bacterium]|nr:hypothetical protein [Dehalococcoidia bacterium]
MQRTFLVVGVTVAALVAMLAISMSIGRGGDSPVAEAQGPTPTKIPEGTGNLSGIYDVLVYAGDPSVGLFHCIARQDHYPDNTLKNAAVCFSDTDQGDPNSQIPATCPKPGPCNRGPNVLPGPNPPPPYGGGAAAKGNGTYNPGTDTVTVRTCFDNIGGALGPNVIAVVTIPAAKAQLPTGTQTGSVLVHANQSNAASAAKEKNGAAPTPMPDAYYPGAD